MPLKTSKVDAATTLTLEWALHVQNFKLTLDKTRCVGCQICSLACPKEAIKTVKQPKLASGKAQKANVDIDLAKCNFCGICDVTCPFGAIKIELNGKHSLGIIEKDSFPQIIRDISTDETRLTPEMLEQKDVCPLNLIHFSSQQQRGKPRVTIDIDCCPCCGICETRLAKVIHVRKFSNGKISINPEKCPVGCRDCVDVCPITGTLYFSNDDGKVHINESSCVYCGACKTVCPREDALQLKRISILHTPVRSGAWNKALERLTSSVEMSKELKTKGSMRAIESVKKRVGSKETD
jgi:4Fe-4S ferredoxin